MNLGDVAVFAEVAAGSSLSSAARKLGITPMAASRKLLALEKELGARLVHRTTRSVGLTVEGEEFAPLAKVMLDAELSSRGLFELGRKSVTGTLRLTSPAVFGATIVVPLLPKLRELHPDLRVDLTLSDSVVDLVGLGLDLALRLASLRDSGLVARPVAPNPRILCASPEYLSRRGTPRTIADLNGHECLLLHSMAHWPFQISGALEPIKVTGCISANSVAAVREACIQGLGLSMLTYWDVKDQLRDGTLTQLILDDATPEDLSIWAVFPTRQHVPSRVRAFLSLLEEVLSQDLP